MRNNLIKLVKANFWKRQIGSLVLTAQDGGFDIRIQLYNRKGCTIGEKVVPHYEVNQEVKALGFGKYL